MVETLQSLKYAGNGLEQFQQMFITTARTFAIFDCLDVHDMLGRVDCLLSFVGRPYESCVWFWSVIDFCAMSW